MASSTSATNTSHSEPQISAPTPAKTCLINDKKIQIIFLAVVAILLVVIATLTTVIIYLRRKRNTARFRHGDPEIGGITKEHEIDEFAPLAADVCQNETLRHETTGHYVVSKTTESCDCDLYILFRKLIEVLGTAGCVKLFINIDPDGDFTDVLTRTNFENCFKFLVNWASKNPNVSHGDIIKRSLAKIGYRLPPDSELYGVDAENRDDGVTISKLLVSLTKTCLLNAAFSQFCLSLAGKLSVTEMWRVTEEVNLRSEMDVKSRCGSIDAAFAETLVEWGLSSPFTHGDGGQWDKLMVLKSSLVEACGEMAVTLFESTAASLMDVLKK